MLRRWLTCFIIAIATPSDEGVEVSSWSDTADLVQIQLDGGALTNGSDGEALSNTSLKKYDARLEAPERQLSRGMLSTRPLPDLGWDYFWDTLQERIITTCACIFGFTCCATGMLANDNIRHNWRNLKLASLPVSCYGGFILYVQPANPWAFLCIIYPLCALAEPRWDVVSMYRGVQEVGFFTVFMAWIFATGHHVGLGLFLNMINQVATLRGYATMGALPWQVILALFLEPFEWVLEALILLRKLPPWGHYLLPLSLSVHCAAIASNIHRNIDIGVCAFIWDQSVLLVGCFAGVICAVCGIKTSTYEFADSETTYEKSDLDAISSMMAPRRSFSRIQHEAGLVKQGSTGSSSTAVFRVN